MAFYKKPSKETMDKRKEEYAKTYSEQIKWFKKNMSKLNNNMFLLDMYSILVTGSRPMSEKMVGAVNKAMKSPQYDDDVMAKRHEKIKPILEKIDVVYQMVRKCDEDKDSYYLQNYSALPFVESIKKQLTDKGTLSEKQMGALNKVFKKYTEGINNMSPINLRDLLDFKKINNPINKSEVEPIESLTKSKRYNNVSKRRSWI